MRPNNQTLRPPLSISVPGSALGNPKSKIRNRKSKNQSCAAAPLPIVKTNTKTKTKTGEPKNEDAVLAADAEKFVGDGDGVEEFERFSSRLDELDPGYLLLGSIHSSTLNCAGLTR